MRKPALLARASLLFALAVPLGSVACTPSIQAPVQPSPVHIEGTVTPQEVPDAEFATSVHKLLRDGKPSAERLGLLVGVVRRQLAHASQRFGSGHDARGTAAVIGAFYLVRPGEGRKEMVDAGGERALAAALERLGPRGDEGRALAIMKMRSAALPAGTPQKIELDEHLAALEQWMKETRTGSAMRRLGAEERAQVARALIEPSDGAVEDASQAIDAWITQALKLNTELRQSGRRVEREEAIEIERALDSGGATMAALFLRYGDAAGALRHLDESSAKHVTLTNLYARIHEAAAGEDQAAKSYLALAGAFAHQDAEESNPETDIDPELLSAGLWGASIEAYRRDPQNLDAALLVSRSLLRYGLPEAAPLVVSEALGAKPAPPLVSAAMEMVLGAVGDSADIDDLDAARRTFAAAGPVLAIADRADLKGRVDPSPARARSVMASIEIRGGNLSAARALLQAALASEPTAAGYTTLALVERQGGDAKAALAAVEEALRAPDARAALLDVAEAHLTAFELFRDGASADKAKPALDAALAACLAARQSGGPAGARARAERLLGRILANYGEGTKAAKAYDRALQIVAADRPMLGATMLDAVGRALLRKDLVGARLALKKGLDGDAGEDDLVYAGLWVQLLEKELKAAPDGTVERALRSSNKAAWTAKLSAWASGKLSDTDLSTAAQSASQKVEAAFYTAMAKKALGDPAADQRLRAVAESPVMDLLEVQLAREIVAPRVRADLPGGVQLP